MKKLIIVPFLLWTMLLQSQDVISGIEWWIDGDYENAAFQALDPTHEIDGIVPVDFSSIPNGTHTIFFRFRSFSGKWSPVVVRHFTKTPSGSDVSLITRVQFWTDDSDGGIKEQPIDLPAENFEDVLALSLAEIQTGRNTLYLRFKDSNGKWSQPFAHRITRIPQGDDKVYVAAMEYWWDHDTNNSKWHFFDDQSATVHTTLPISFADIDVGTHLVHIRFYNNLGQASEVHRSFVNKFPEGMEHNLISAYRYWFNNDSLSVVRKSFQQEQSNQEGTITLSLDAFNPGDTVLVSMQFLDELEQWSAVHTESVTVYDPTFIDNHDLIELVLYPNPVRAGEVVFVEWQRTSLPVSLFISDSEGRIVVQQDIASSEINFITLNIQTLGRGVYSLTFYSGDQKVTKRLVIL